MNLSEILHHFLSHSLLVLANLCILSPALSSGSECVYTDTLLAQLFLTKNFALSKSHFVCPVGGVDLYALPF